MKRSLSLLLVLTLIFVLFAGCGGNDEPSVSTPNASDPTEAPASVPDSSLVPEPTPEVDPLEVTLPLVEETETFTMLYPFFPLLASYMESLSDNSVIKYMEDITNIHLEIMDASLFTFADTLNLYISSGDLPDIVYNFARYYTLGMEHAIDEEIIVDLSDYADFLPNYYYQIDRTDMANELFTDSGALPAAYYISEDVVISMGLITRQDWLDAQNIETPATIDEFYDMLVHLNTEYGATMWLGKYGAGPSHAIASAYGVTAYTGSANSGESLFINKNGTVCFSPLEDGFKNYIATMSQWYNEGLIYSDFVSGETQSPATEDLTTGNFSVWYGDKAAIGNLALYGDASAVEVGLASPTLNKGDILHVNSSNEKYDGTGMAVSTNCENVELLCHWLDYWYTEAGSTLVSWGIEGEAFEYDENHQPYFTDYVLNNPDGIDSTTMFSMVCLAGAPGVKSLDSQMAILTEAQRNATQVWGSNSDASYLMPSGISMNTEEIEDYNYAYGDILTFVNEKVMAYITGEIDYETDWDNFISTIEGMDIDVCIAAKQSALDRYFSRG